MAKKKLSPVVYGILAVVSVSAIAATVGVTASQITASVLAQMDGSIFNTQDFQDLQRAEEDARRFKEDLSNETRHLKDRTRECKDMQSNIKQNAKRGGKNIPQSYKERSQSLLQKVGGLCGQVEAGKKCLTKAKSSEDIQDCRSDIIQEMSDSFGELHDEQNELNNIVNVLEASKEFDRWQKDWQRMRKEIANEAKQNRIDKEKINSALAPLDEKIKECTNMMQTYRDALKGNDFETANDATNDIRQCGNEIWPFKDEIRQGLFACSNINRTISEVEKGIKGPRNLEKSLTKRGKDTSALRELISGADQAIANAKEKSNNGECDEGAQSEFQSQLEDFKSQFEQVLEDLGVNSGEAMKKY